MTKAISLLHQMTLEHPTEFWNDSCEVKSLARAIEQGATGATSNPVIVVAAIEADRPRWEEITRALIHDHTSRGIGRSSSLFITSRALISNLVERLDMLRIAPGNGPSGSSRRLAIQPRCSFFDGAGQVATA